MTGLELALLLLAIAVPVVVLLVAAGRRLRRQPPPPPELAPLSIHHVIDDTGDQVYTDVFPIRRRRP